MDVARRTPEAFTHAILTECLRQAEDVESAVPASIFVTTQHLLGLNPAISATVRKLASDFADARLNSPWEVERVKRFEFIGACKVALAYLEFTWPHLSK